MTISARLGLLALLLAASLGLGLVAALAVGPPGLVIPLLVLGAVLGLRGLVRATFTPTSRTVLRDGGAALVAVVTGVGAWLAAIIAGILLEVLPFLVSGEDHPFADAWEAGSVLVGLAAVPATWVLVRRYVDESLR